MKRFFEVVKRIVENKLCWIFLTVNVLICFAKIATPHVFIVWLFSEAETPCQTVAEHQFTMYQMIPPPIWMIVWIVLSLPAFVVIGIFQGLAERLFPSACVSTIQHISQVVSLSTNSFYWFLIGRIADKFLFKKWLK